MQKMTAGTPPVRFPHLQAATRRGNLALRAVLRPQPTRAGGLAPGNPGAVTVFWAASWAAGPLVGVAGRGVKENMPKHI
jgi:hypothetical protein